ncbi:hypothetical protein EV424DRAFT_1074724 [Suillus variegatus]|nr:hypothetical protein EV424DRAFT_1074724 [Suillus variegatus]
MLLHRLREEAFAAASVFWIGFGTLLIITLCSNTRYSLGPQLDHNLKLQLHRNCKLSHVRRYQVDPEQASPTGTQRPTVVSPPRSNSPGVPQQFTPHSPKPVPFNLLNLSSQHSQPNQMQTLILSNTNLEGLMYLQRKFMGIISPLILIVRQWTMRTLTKTKSTAKSRSFSQGLGFSNTST